MHKVYARLGFALNPPVAAAMQRFLDAGTATERHGKHRYDIAESGIDLAAERLRFADYQRAYAIPDEIFST